MGRASSSAVYANKYRRDRDREDYRRDILQVGDEGFIKEYPERAREFYDDETMRKYG